MDLQYEVNRKRKEFGVHAKFQDLPCTKIIFDENDEDMEECISPRECPSANWEPKQTKTQTFESIPQYSVHAVNTEPFIQCSVAVNHTEGGWPQNVNQAQDKQRYIRKIEADSEFTRTCTDLVKTLKIAIEANLTIDLYKKYFDQETEDFSTDPPNANTIYLVRDPTGKERSACKIAWHPENPHRFAVSYASTVFEKSASGNVPLPSYIWDLNNAIGHCNELLPDSPILCLAFGPKRPDELAGGCFNGTVAFWDTRCDKRPREQSPISVSHEDPVTDICFIQARSGTEFCSVSTDGVMLWWDGRRLTEPIDRFDLIDPETNIRHGATCLEYRLDAGATKYLVGTESGLVFNVERKAKKDQESQKTIKAIYGKKQQHFGPIYSIQRNFAAIKGFLTCGDWGCRMWTEEVRSPNFGTKYDTAMINCAVWSPTRFGIFFVGKDNGCLDIWDYMYTQEAPVWSQKIFEVGITTLTMNKSGYMLAIGAADGSTCIMKLSKSLTSPGPTEKSDIQQMFEREGIREKTLNQALKSKASAALQVGKRQKQKEAEVEALNQKNAKFAEKFQENITDIEKKFEVFLQKNEPEPLADEYMHLLNLNKTKSVSSSNSKPVVQVVEESKPVAKVVEESKPVVKVVQESKPVVKVVEEPKPVAKVVEELKPEKEQDQNVDKELIESEPVQTQPEQSVEENDSSKEVVKTSEIEKEIKKEVAEKELIEKEIEQKNNNQTEKINKVEPISEIPNPSNMGENEKQITEEIKEIAEPLINEQTEKSEKNTTIEIEKQQEESDEDDVNLENL